MGFVAYKKELLVILTGFKKPADTEDFLVDLLTPAEWREVVLRWQLVKQLNAGVHQRDIAKNLGVSIAKITRGSRVLLNKNGGFNKILKLKKKHT